MAQCCESCDQPEKIKTTVPLQKFCTLRLQSEAGCTWVSERCNIVCPDLPKVL
jgi:hypothetical protein